MEQENTNPIPDTVTSQQPTASTVLKKRGRPPGSKNKPKPSQETGIPTISVQETNISS